MPFRMIDRGDDSPWSMSSKSWKKVALRTWGEAGVDNIALVAAGVAFYGFLALVPLLGATVLLYGFIADPSTVVHDVQRLAAVMPSAAAKLIGDQLLGVVETSGGKKGTGLVIALGIALFGARNGAGAIITALNIAYEQKERRGFIHLTLLALAITAAAVIIAVFAAAAIAALGHLQQMLPELPRWSAVLGKAFSYLALGCLAAAGAAALYRFGPSREGKKITWIWLTPGSVLTALLWLALTLGFGIYVANFGRYDASYGSLGTVVVLLTWLYLSSYILLFGAELNFECEREAGVEPDRPSDGDAASPLSDASDRREGEISLTPPEEKEKPPRESGPAVGDVLKEYASGRLAAKVSHAAGFGKVGMLTSGLAAFGLARVRHGRQPVVGLAILAGAASIAWWRRDRKSSIGLRAVLLDIDGTLVDSNGYHVEAWAEAFRSEGHVIGSAAIHAQIGKGGDHLVPALLPHASRIERQRIADAHDDLFKRRFLAKVRPFTRATDLVRAIRARGLKVVLASSASQEELDHYTKLLGIADLVDATTTIDDVKSSKPSPDIFSAAVQKVGAEPSDAMVVGDSPYDIDAATRSGISAIALRSGGFTDDWLAGAVAIYDDVSSLLAHLEGSPLERR